MRALRYTLLLALLLLPGLASAATLADAPHPEETLAATTAEQRVAIALKEETRAEAAPEPVGAAISTCWRAAIAGHAARCTSVGAAKVRANQAATAGWKEAGMMN